MQPHETPEHFIANLGLAVVMVSVTVVIHFVGLLALSVVLRRGAGDRMDQGRHAARRFLAILVAVLGLFLLHTTQIWAYAALYHWGLGLFDDFETALYFSTQTFVALGYGDVQVPRDWRLIGAIEAANGLILMGWSTAFLVSIMGRLRALEHEWLEHGRE
jgi:hypothetical protein